MKASKRIKSTESKSPMNKLIRKKQSPTKTGKKQGPAPFQVFLKQMCSGVVLAYVTVPNNQNRAAYIQPIVRKLEDPEQMELFNVDLVCSRRVEIGENTRMPDRPGSSYYFFQFVRVFEDEEMNTPENVREWGETLARKFTETAAVEYTYPKSFVFAANVTEETENGDFPCADKYLLNEDVMKLLDMVYPPSQYSRVQQAEFVATDFFGTHFTADEAKNFVEDYPTPEV